VRSCRLECLSRASVPNFVAADFVARLSRSRPGHLEGGRHDQHIITTTYDAIIIGTGQAGPPLAKRLSDAGMSVAIVERHLFGGTCGNTGCIPTKAMVASAYAAQLARRAADFGVAIDSTVRVDMKRVNARTDAFPSSRVAVLKRRCARPQELRGVHRTSDGVSLLTQRIARGSVPAPLGYPCRAHMRLLCD
jgi:hypothetical protein